MIPIINLKEEVMELAEVISVALSAISIIGTVWIAIGQSKLNERIALYDERHRTILQIQNNEILDDVEMKILFPKCVDAYQDWVDLCKRVSETEYHIMEYFATLAYGEGRSKNDISSEFYLVKKNSEKSGDDSFKAFCKEREITYIPLGQEVPVTRNYYEMDEQKTVMKMKCEESKRVLIEKLCKLMKS